MKKKVNIAILSSLLMGMALLVSPVSVQAGNAIHWLSYEDGVAAGQKHGKKIFLNFYADWCRYCKKMDRETFKDPSVVDYLNKHFISVKVNSDRNKQAARQYGVRGLPTTWFLTESGDKIGSRPGYIPAEDLMVFLRFIQTDSYKDMSLKAFKAKNP